MRFVSAGDASIRIWMSESLMWEVLLISKGIFRMAYNIIISERGRLGINLVKSSLTKVVS